MNSKGVKVTKVMFFKAKSVIICLIIKGDKGRPSIKAEIKKKITTINLFLSSFKCSIALAFKRITTFFRENYPLGFLEPATPFLYSLTASPIALAN